MKISEIKKQIKGVFKLPIKKYYFGKVKHGTPYFFPWDYVGSIIFLRIGERPKYARFSTKIFKLFGKSICLGIGYPIKIVKYDLGWKDKFNSPRHEWNPAFHIFFFGLQFCYWYIAPCDDNDGYWEQILWFLNYSDKNIQQAEASWPWTNYETKKSTWNKNHLE